MLEKNIKIVDLGYYGWIRLFDLFKCIRGPKSDERKPGPLLLIYRGLRLLRALDLGSMSPVNVNFSGTSRLDVLSDESGFPVVIALEENAVARVAGHAQKRIRYDDDYFSQLGTFIAALSAEWRKTIFTYPPGPARIPVPSYRLINGVLRLLIPDNSILLFTVTEREVARSSIAVGYRGGDFWLLTTLEAVGSEDADLSGGLLGEAADALGRKFGGVVRVVAVEREALTNIARSRLPAGAILWAVNTGRLRLLKIPWRWKVLFWGLIGVRPAR